jgi:hypothetical protein
MRKILALSMVAILSLTVALAAGCGGQQTDTSTTTTTTETTMPPDTGMAPMDTSMIDTTSHP